MLKIRILFFITCHLKKVLSGIKDATHALSAFFRIGNVMDSHIGGHLCGVQIRGHKDEVPTVGVRLCTDHLLDVCQPIFPRAIFVTIGENLHDNFTRSVGFWHVAQG